MAQTWIKVDSKWIKIQRKRSHIFSVFVSLIVMVTALQYFHLAQEKLKPVCEVTMSKLRTKIPVNQEPKLWEELERIFTNVSLGGSWAPKDCHPIQNIAIYMPFRDRIQHLRVFLAHMHPFLQKQKIAYTIYAIEPDPMSVFNRGLLGNIGFVETRKNPHHDCFIFHDVDLLPENEQNLYKCQDNPKHMSTFVDSLGYSLPYKEITGGIGAFRAHHLTSINGFSNYFFRWGGEDDDLFGRFYSQGWTVDRDRNKTGMYVQLKHDKAEKNPLRFAMIAHSRKRRQKTDGLSSLHEFYTLEEVVKHKLYTQVKVKVNDKKADFVINSIVQEIRDALPSKFRHINSSLIIQTVEKIGMYYVKPVQVAKQLKDLISPNSRTWKRLGW